MGVFEADSRSNCSLSRTFNGIRGPSRKSGKDMSHLPINSSYTYVVRLTIGTQSFSHIELLTVSLRLYI